MVSKCCWRESAKEASPKDPEHKFVVVEATPDNLRGKSGNNVNRASNASSSTLVNYEDECDKTLDITDLTVPAKNHNTGSFIKRKIL